MVEGSYGLPLVFTKDGGCFQLLSQPTGEGAIEYHWKALPPIPGSPALLTYWPDNGKPRMYDDPEAGARPFLPEDQ